MANQETTRAYIACLSAYNNGINHGAWFDLEDYTDVSDLHDAIKERVLLTSPRPNVTVECSHCETGRRGMGCAEGKTFKGFYHCDKCDGYGNRPSSEEWAYHAYDGDCLDQFGEYPNEETLLAFVALVQEHGDAFLAYVSHVGLTYAVEDDNFTDAYHTSTESVKTFAEDHLQESGMLDRMPKELVGYIDYEMYGRDLSHNGTFAFVEYGKLTYVFHTA